MLKIKILQKPKVIEIIKALYPDKKYSFTKLTMEAKGSTPTISHRISELANEKILNEIYETKFQGKRLISLTEKGRKIAEHLLKIEKLLNDA